jgi:hypothetical protein
MLIGNDAGWMQEGYDIERTKGEKVCVRGGVLGTFGQAVDNSRSVAGEKRIFDFVSF